MTEETPLTTDQTISTSHYDLYLGDWGTCRASAEFGVKETLPNGQPGHYADLFIHCQLPLGHDGPHRREYPTRPDWATHDEWHRVTVNMRPYNFPIQWTGDER